MVNDLSTNGKDWESLIGKTLRKKNMLSLGIIVKIDAENDAYWNNDKVWMVTDKDERILINKIGQIREESVILVVY
jgi:hypothetical protein